MPNVIKDKFDRKEDVVTSVLDTAKRADGTIDVKAVEAILRENGITPRQYPNPGMLRMNAANMLRGIFRKNGKVVVRGTEVSKVLSDDDRTALVAGRAGKARRTNKAA